MSENDSAPMDPIADADPCVSEFLARHGISSSISSEEESKTSPQAKSSPATSEPQTIVSSAQPKPEPPKPQAVPSQPSPPPVSTEAKTAAPAPISATAPAAARSAAAPQEMRAARPKRPSNERKREAGALRQLRANSIAVSLSKSNQMREKLNEAARFLGISLIAGFLALILAFCTSAIPSFVFFAALITLVLGIICVYRSTLIMTRLHRIAKI